MEILFFLVILGIQFAYQIYQAINKRKVLAAKKNAQSTQTDSEENSDYYSEYSGSSDYAPEPLYEEESPKMEEPEKEGRRVRPKTGNFYEQIFGFVEDSQRTDINSRKTFASEEEFYESIFHDPKDSQEDSLENQDQVFSYDDSVEETSDITTPETHFSKVKQSDVPHYTEQILADSELPNLGLPNLGLPNVSRIRKKIHNPQNLKDNWRIKFILDRPGGLSQNQHFF